ncbi:MAG: hypothetical protein JSW34_02415, partial [Candidatus Zixiibacteriota bacterium]
LQKFGAANEFVAFLQSPQGQAMLSNGDVPETIRSRTSIRFVQIGILMLFAGIGIFIFVYMYGGTTDREMREVLAVLSFSGTTAISLGVGLFVTAAVTSIWERWSGGHDSSTT